MLVATGEFSRDSGWPGATLASWDGAAWTDFPTPGWDLYSPHLIHADKAGSRLIVLRREKSVHIRENGSWREETLPGLTASIEDIESAPVGATDDIYLTGRFWLDAGMFTPVLHWDGQSWESLGETTNSEWASDGAWFDDGSGTAFYAAGSKTLGGVQVDYLGRWNGTTWEAVAPGRALRPRKIAVLDNGSGGALYATDGFTIGRWDGATWTESALPSDGNSFVGFQRVDLGGVEKLVWAAEERTGTMRIWTWDGSTAEMLTGEIAGTVDSIDVPYSSDDAFIVCGDLISAGGVPASAVAAFDGTAWHAVGTSDVGNGAPDASSVLAVGPEGGDAMGNRVYVGGSMFAGGAACRRLASWNGQSWDRFAPPDWPEFFGGAMTYGDLGDGGRLYYATASRDLDQGTPVRGVASWDGNEWTMLPPAYFSSSPRRLVIGDVGGQRMLYAAGGFRWIYGQQANYLAGFDGVNWTVLGGGADDRVWDAVIFDDGTGPSLYIGGEFGMVGQVAAPGVARWDGQAWHPVGYGFDTRFGHTIRSLAVADLGEGPRLFAGGFVETSGPTTVKNIAMWNGTAWEPLGAGVGGSVWGLAQIQTSECPRLAVAGDGVRLWDGTSWGVLEDDMNGTVLGVTQAPFDQDAVYIVGEFSEVAGVPSEGIARWGCASSCAADFNGDGVVDTRDFIAFLNAWASQDSSADIDGNGVIDTRDVVGYLNLWAAGC
ncbi:MAG: hypothetical protein IPJ41_03685 [Phycisphaerales bacterium]|nr:hypothetical protein [Phycisphaerales bacterium]